MQRLGLIGGTFDPIHVGHVLLAQFVCEQLHLDRVLFVPAAVPPHKRTCQAEAAHRWAMVELAIAGFPHFQASRIELDRPGMSYTVDTLRQVRATWPATALYLIVGADNVGSFSTWHNPAGILELCTVVAGARIAEQGTANPALASHMIAVDTPVVQFSSTLIRQRLAQEQPIRYMVPEKVEDYIRAHRLYRG